MTKIKAKNNSKRENNGTNYKNERNKNLEINSSEFEGLLGFEEIKAYPLIKEKSYKRNTQKIQNENRPTYNKKESSKALGLQKKKKFEKKKCSLSLENKNSQAHSNKRKNECLDNPVNKKKCFIDIESWKSIFAPECVIEAIKDIGFKEPSAIQKLCIPAAVKGRKDIIGAAETGSGKTLAFVIPIIHGILVQRSREAEKEQIDNLSSESEEEEVSDREDETGLQNKKSTCVKVINDAQFDFLAEEVDKTTSKTTLRALIVTPTRELAVQIKKHTDAVLSHTDIKCAIVIGGLAQEKQERVLAKGPEIVIGTPGRLWELVQQGNAHLSQIPFLKFLAIDETDRMLEKGHFEDLQHLLELINSNPKAAKLRQTFIFSATLTLTHDAPKRSLTKKKLVRLTSEMKLQKLIDAIGVREKPKIVDITRRFGTAETLSETKIFCDKEEKDSYLYYFLTLYPGRTLVFCNSINCVRRLSKVLALLQCDSKSLHASKQQKQRLKNLERFASNPRAVLLATDVAARGIDIPGVDHIFHYEVPRTAETYVHRSGRTARASREGLSVLLVESAEVGRYRQLCATLNREAELPAFPVDDSVLSEVKRRVKLARDVESLQHREDKKRVDGSWLERMAEEAELELKSESESSDDDEAYESTLNKKKTESELEAKKAQLRRLLSRPLAGAAFSARYPTSSGHLVLPVQPAQGGAIQQLKERGKTTRLGINVPKRVTKRKKKKNKVEP